MSKSRVTGRASAENYAENRYEWGTHTHESVLGTYSQRKHCWRAAESNIPSTDSLSAQEFGGYELIGGIPTVTRHYCCGYRPCRLSCAVARRETR